ncbi:Hypothetical protein NTJ_00534 [Nesidiocoris tenuis]|uniref:Uncharacterized protein n=1 Tax=Nesidiocoris tenuis TaxID=355587 RepID=A0ABN7A6C5_9HEMI|nr:Hypothetical protein NTJ_00534 [Nesidiocoris tenuis]
MCPCGRGEVGTKLVEIPTSGGGAAAVGCGRVVVHPWAEGSCTSDRKPGYPPAPAPDPAPYRRLSLFNPPPI